MLQCMSCKVNGCEKPSSTKGLCKTHYGRLLRGKPLDAPVRPRSADLASLHQYLSERSQPGQNGCIDWTGSVRSDGYGQISIDRRRTGVHRLAYELHAGQSIPEGMLVLHSCDRPICINPAHLRVGTHKENVRDAILRERRPGKA